MQFPTNTHHNPHTPWPIEEGCCSYHYPSPTAADLLRATRALLTPDHAWSQGAFAYTEHDDETEPERDNAVRWCLLGAEQRSRSDIGAGTVADLHAMEYLLAAIGQAYDVRDPRDNASDDPADIIVNWNDDGARTHAQVLAVLDTAVTLAEVPR